MPQIMQSDPRNPRSHDGPVQPARLGVRLQWVLAVTIGEEKIITALALALTCEIGGKNAGSGTVRFLWGFVVPT